MRLRIRTICLLIAAGTLAGCDMGELAIATAPLAAPVDSTCLRRFLSKTLPESFDYGRFTPARPGSPARLDLLFQDDVSISQIYSDSVRAELAAQQITRWGLAVLVSPHAAERDSISRALGVTLRAARDACGGHPPPDAPGPGSAN